MTAFLSKLIRALDSDTAMYLVGMICVGAVLVGLR